MFLKHKIFLVTAFVVAIVRLGTAQVFPITNPEFEWLSGKLDHQSSFEQFGNYNDRLFLIGWFDEKAYRYYKSFGNVDTPETYRHTFGPVNMIRAHIGSFTGEFGYPTQMIAELRRDAQTQPIKFVLVLPQKIKVDGRNEYLNKKNGGVDELVRVLSELKSKLGGSFEDIFGWYTIDEPNLDKLTREEFVSYNEAIREAERRVGSERKEIFVTLPQLDYPRGTGNRKNFDAFATDPNVTAINCDDYPFKHNEDYFTTRMRGMSRLITRTRERLDALKLAKPIIAVPQGFAHRCCAYEASPPNLHNWGRAPSYAEYRHQFFSAIASGAVGVWPWAARVVYFDDDQWNDDGVYGTQFFRNQKPNANPNEIAQFYRQEQDWIFGNVKTVYDELEPLTQKMLNGKFIDDFISWEILNPRAGQVEESFVRAIFFEHGNEYYLIAVNNNHRQNQRRMQPQTIKFHFEKKQPSHPDVVSTAISVTRVDPFEYTAGTHYSDLQAANSQIIAVRAESENQRLKSFIDRFEAGEVHVYQILVR